MSRLDLPIGAGAAAALPNSPLSRIHRRSPVPCLRSVRYQAVPAVC
jgi:hypothetical protein